MSSEDGMPLPSGYHKYKGHLLTYNRRWWRVRLLSLFSLLIAFLLFWRFFGSHLTIIRSSFGLRGDQQPELSVGIIADIQYCDIPDGWNRLHTFQRFYRYGLVHLRNALSEWRDLPLILNLGDSFDSTCAKLDKTGRLKWHAMHAMEKTFADGVNGASVHHLLGNNDLENFDRVQYGASFLFSKTRAKGQKESKEPVNNPGLDLNTYYSISPVNGIRLVFLDTMDISASGWPKHTLNHREGWKILTKYNHNKNLNSDAGLPDSIRRYVMYNGNVSRTQLQWFDETLTVACEKLEETVLVIAHHPLLIAVSNTLELVWNNQQVLDILRKHRKRGKGNCPAIYLNGDAHWYKAARDPDGGLLHVTLPGVIQASNTSKPYTRVDIFSDKIILRGTDIIKEQIVRL